MRRWNGWGNENSDLTTELNSGLRSLLEHHLGPAESLGEATLEQVIAKVPPSRLAPHPLFSLDAETRVRHARGQSLPAVQWTVSPMPSPCPSHLPMCANF
jgi:alkyldihydroxyacetonephosphate synthase